VNPEKWEQIKELLGAALEKEPAERSSFLRKACGSDDALHRELEALLAAYDAEKSLAAEPLPGRLKNSRDDSGKKIGAYRVIRQIGMGGMGAVYLAVRADDTFNKQVAIKLVQAGIDTEEILQRFRHERQILATFDHPNIAKLLDGGTTEEGLPYFVMDYVEGTRIDEYCESHKLLISERIRLFRDICSAVQYVHQNLVVHRDLKPSNILVTPEGIPKLLDFGIAKLLKPEMFTNLADATRVEFRLMTPGYASPEQVRGEPVTTASDVYSLGVILYELLTSRRPYKVKTDSPAEILRAVCDQEPERPSTAIIRQEETRDSKRVLTPKSIAADRGTLPDKLQKQLRGDLDTIVVKALRKEPQRRYASAERLSEDLRHYLVGLPVSAHRDTRSYRAGKFVRRHKTGVAAVALIAILLIGGVLATTWQARVARAERANAQQEFNDVRKLTTSFLFEFHSAIQNLPGSTPARKLLVQRALEYLSKLAQQSRGDASLQSELAEAYLKVGDVQGNPYVANLGDTEGAAQSYRRALEISQALIHSNANDADAKRYLARSYKSLGEVLPILGQPTDGLANLRLAMQLLQTMAVTDSGDQQLQAELANCYQAIGDLQGHSGLQNLGDPTGALVSYMKALAIYQVQVSGNVNNQEARRGLAVLQLRIGDLEMEHGDPKDGMNQYRNALAILEEVSASNPTNADARRLLALGYQKVGGAQEDVNPKEALASYAKAAAINEGLMTSDPNNAQASMSLAITLRYTGDLQKKRGDRADALANYERVLQILGRLAGSEPRNVLLQGRYSEMLSFTADLLAQSGKLDEARRMTSRSLAITRELASRDDATPDDLFTYAQIFLTCTPADLRDPSTALQYAKRSVEKSGGKDSDSLDLLAQAYFQSGDPAHAIEAEQKALSALPPSQGQEPVSSPRRKMEQQLARYKAAKGNK
jgi:non-specific serine/threonine protein kinase/serine/threonine-protein kinase